MRISKEYQSIINSLDYINRSDARDFSIYWVSGFKARIVNDGSTIHAITVLRTELLDHAVADYLVAYCERLAKIRFGQFFKFNHYRH